MADALTDRLLALPAATGPSFAADGRLLFLNDAGGSAQVWELPAGGGPARPRTAHRDAVAFVAGSPVDGSAVFGRDQGGDERQQLYALPPDGEARALTVDTAVIHGLGAISPNGSQIAHTGNARDPAHADAWITDLASGERRCVRKVEGPQELPCWHPASGAFVLATAPRSFEMDLVLVDAATGEATPLTPHDGDARHMNPRWRRDGAGFWLLTDRGRDHLAAAWMTPGGTPRLLHAPLWDVEKLEVSPDQREIAVAVNEEGWSRLRLLDAETGAVRAVIGCPDGVVTKLSWRQDGGAIAFDLARPDRPAGIWLAEASAGWKARQVFGVEGPASGARDYALVRFPSFDGREIPAWLALPEGAPPVGGWPVLVWVHGGPAAQALPNWRPDLQALLALGIAVLIPNVRGSTGYGRAYAELDDREKRPDSVADLAAAHRWLAARPDVDGARIAIMGQSYGGWMVLSALTKQPELWAAGVEFYGIARWKTFFEATGPWRVAHRAAEYGDPVADAALLESLSPLHEASRIVCPLFVAQGLTDPRVPPRESEQIVAALRAHDVPVEYLTFPDEGHGFTKRDNRRVVYAAVARFLTRHLGVG